MTSFCRKALRLFHYVLLKSQKALLRHPVKVLTFSTLLFVIMLTGATRLKIGIRAEDWLDHRLESTIQYLELKETFGSEDKLSWIVPVQWNKTDLCKNQTRAMRWPWQEVKLIEVTSIFDLRLPHYKFSEKTLFYPLELEEDCKFSEQDLVRVQKNPLADSLFVNANQDLLFHFTFQELEISSKWGKTDFPRIEKWTDHLKTIEPTSFIGGPLFFQKSTKDGISWSSKLNFLTAVVIALCCRIFLGTWLSGIILVVLIAFTTSSLQTGMTLRGDVADPLSASIFVLMTIAIVEDFFFSFYYSRSQKVRLRTALRRMILPSFFTSLTTAIGLGSLAASSNMSVENLGFWTGLGSMIEWSLVFFVLPAACKLFPRLDYLAWKGNAFLPKRFWAIGNYQPSKKIVFVLTLPLMLIFFTYDKANINYTPFDMFPADHPLVQFRDYIKTHRGFEGDVSLVFNHENLTAEDSELIEKVAEHPLIEFHKNPYKIIKNLLPQDTDEGLNRLIESEISNTKSLEDFQQNGKSRALLFIKEYDIKSLEAITAHANKICQGKCYLSGEIVAFKDYALSMLNTLYSSFIFSLLSVSVLLALLSIAVSGKVFWPLILSSIWAPLMLLISVSLFEIKINVVTCLALNLMIGLSGDNAVQFLLFDRKGRWKRGHEQLRPVGLMIITTIALISLILLLSQFRTARILSGLMEFGAVLMLVGDLWILNYFTSVKVPNTNSSQ